MYTLWVHRHIVERDLLKEKEKKSERFSDLVMYAVYMRNNDTCIKRCRFEKTLLIVLCT